MATVRDSDISLWLHNKLGTSNDSWTSGSICSQLNSEVLRNIKDCFPDLQTQVKLKLLLSFFHIPRRNIEEWRVELEEIVEVAQVDSEQWVSMLAEMMKTLPSTGSLNTVISENEQNKRIFSDLVSELRKLVRKQTEMNLLPLECHYLNKSALNNLVGQLPGPVKHFTLKRKPKSAALRAELLQKSIDAASNLKKSAAPTVPVRSRGMPRKMTDTTPLKGIPSRVPSGGFQSGMNSSLMSRPTMPRSTLPRKDGGIKLLDINEQPMAYAQAKKRKRMQELEEAAAQKKASAEAATSTPDYAAGLAPPSSVAPATPAAAQQVEQPAIPQQPPSYAPVIPQQSPAGVNSITQGVMASSSVPNQPTINLVPVAMAKAEIVNQVEPERRQIVTTATIIPTKPPEEKTKLLLTRDQILEAQKMFETANKVTRPEKALILGFMAGARENPCPQLGNIVTIKLSENKLSPEDVMYIDGTPATQKVVETHFQMNYNTGEWKLMKKYRDVS
ncbi:negative elongation factor A isoform X2 [Halyomorpha halys]|uniref:negative elongation factor A isoform X2 n=1 Tax=Halyomorpha halys TaxID=286706 RepID=UPI0006D51186|nr:negative elongation factor A isoform X2 [Halyomorpha halys]